jgi:hypothetical protein
MSVMASVGASFADVAAMAPWQFLYRLPLPQGQGSFREAGATIKFSDIGFLKNTQGLGQRYDCDTPPIATRLNALFFCMEC